MGPSGALLTLALVSPSVPAAQAAREKGRVTQTPPRSLWRPVPCCSAPSSHLAQVSRLTVAAVVCYDRKPHHPLGCPGGLVVLINKESGFRFVHRLPFLCYNQ